MGVVISIADFQDARKAGTNSAERIKAEKDIAAFMGVVKDIKRAGRLIGRENMLMDLLFGFTDIMCYIENGLAEDITNITAKAVRGATWRGEPTGTPQENNSHIKPLT